MGCDKFSVPDFAGCGRFSVLLRSMFGIDRVRFFESSDCQPASSRSITQPPQQDLAINTFINYNLSEERVCAWIRGSVVCVYYSRLLSQSSPTEPGTCSRYSRYRLGVSMSVCQYSMTAGVRPCHESMHAGIKALQRPFPRVFFGPCPKL